MYKLLNAGLARLRKNNVFWSLIIITLIIASVILLKQYKDFSNGNAFLNVGTENILVYFTQIIGFFIALFTSLFVGIEYSNGTIRNKIVVGHSRKNIYLSNFIISSIVGLVIEFVYIAIIAIVAIPIFGKIQIPLSQFMFIILDIVMIIIAYSSLFNFISMIVTEVTISTALSIILTLVMLFIFLNISLKENTIFNIIPIRQSILINQYLATLKMPQEFRVYANVESLSLYSILFIIFTNTIGIWCFSKKDLK